MLESFLLVTVLRLERNCTHHIFINLREKEDEMAPGLLKILIASMQQYLIMYITLYLFIYMHFICMYYLFSKASGAYVGVSPVYKHRVYRFLQACNYLMKKSI